MCGIAGAINYNKYDMNKVQDSLYHRGPNEQSSYTKDNVVLTKLNHYSYANTYLRLSRFRHHYGVSGPI